jgi:hypothetical protein
VFVHKAAVAGGLDISQVNTAWSENTVTFNSNLQTGAPIQSDVPAGAADSYVSMTSRFWCSNGSPGRRRIMVWKSPRRLRSQVRWWSSIARKTRRPATPHSWM